MGWGWDWLVVMLVGSKSWVRIFLDEAERKSVVDGAERGRRRCGNRRGNILSDAFECVRFGVENELMCCVGRAWSARLR